MYKVTVLYHFLAINTSPNPFLVNKGPSYGDLAGDFNNILSAMFNYPIRLYRNNFHRSCNQLNMKWL